MLKKDLLSLIANVQDEQEIDEVLKDSELVKKFSSLDAFKSKLSTEKDFKAFMDSSNDNYFKKAHKTWEENNLQQRIDEEVKKRFPEKDPKEIENANLKAEIEKVKQESLRKDLVNNALKVAQEKSFPCELIDFVIGSSEEATTKNLGVLETALQAYTKTVREQLINDGSYTPSKNQDNNNKSNSSNFVDIIKDNQAKR